MLIVQDEDRHWWFATRTRAILTYLDRYVGPGRNLRVLDIGCGAANMAHHLSHYGNVVGVDNNPRPLRIALQRGMEAHLGSADDLPFEDASFDLVTLLDTVEHLEAEERVFDECWRVLRDRPANGEKTSSKLLVTVPAFMFLWSQNDVLNAHRRRYTAPELKMKLEQHGFRVLRISYNNFLIFPLAAVLILLRRGRAEPELASPHFQEDAYQVEMEPAPPSLNSLLNGLGKIEAGLLKHISLPVGTSIIAIAEKITK